MFDNIGYYIVAGIILIVFGGIGVGVFAFLKEAFDTPPSKIDYTDYDPVILSPSNFHDGKLVSYAKKFSDMKDAHPFVTALILAKINEFYAKKHNGKALDTTQLNVLMIAINQLSKERCIEIAEFVQNHPYLTVCMIAQFILVYEEKTAKGEKLGIETAIGFLWEMRFLSKISD